MPKGHYIRKARTGCDKSEKTYKNYLEEVALREGGYYRRELDRRNKSKKKLSPINDLT